MNYQEAQKQMEEAIKSAIDGPKAARDFLIKTAASTRTVLNWLETGGIRPPEVVGLGALSWNRGRYNLKIMTLNSTNLNIVLTDIGEDEESSSDDIVLALDNRVELLKELSGMLEE